MAFGFSDVSAEFEWPEEPRRDRRSIILETAKQQGLIGARDKTIGGRVPSALVEAAKARSGIQTDSELILYALSKVALEDDFASRLLALKGSLPLGTALDV